MRIARLLQLRHDSPYSMRFLSATLLTATLLPFAAQGCSLRDLSDLSRTIDPTGSGASGSGAMGGTSSGGATASGDGDTADGGAPSSSGGGSMDATGGMGGAPFIYVAPQPVVCDGVADPDEWNTEHHRFRSGDNNSASYWINWDETHLYIMVQGEVFDGTEPDLTLRIYMGNGVDPGSTAVANVHGSAGTMLFEANYYITMLSDGSEVAMREHDGGWTDYFDQAALVHAYSEDNELVEFCINRETFGLSDRILMNAHMAEPSVKSGDFFAAFPEDAFDSADPPNVDAPFLEYIEFRPKELGRAPARPGGHEILTSAPQ